MKVLLISNYLPDEQESMLRYARLLFSELQAKGVDISIVHPPVIVTRLTGRRGSLGKWAAYFDKYLLAPVFLRKHARNADVVHICDHSNSMYASCAGTKPCIITCHDLLAVFAAQGRFPQIHVGLTGRWLQRWIANGLKHAQYLLCVSQKTMEDVKELCGNQPPMLTLVYNPLNWPYHPVDKAETEKFLAARNLETMSEYILHVGSNSWYKNRRAVVAIFTELKRDPRFQQTKLLLCGKSWDRELAQAVTVSGHARDITDCGQVTNEELRALYSGAFLFLYPSLEEGFGWPILEAQASGCVVATTNRPPMTEVGGRAAILIEPTDYQAASATILQALPRFEQLRREGLVHAATFTVKRSMDQVYTLYEQVLAAKQI